MWRGCSRPRLTLELRLWRHVPDLFWQFIQVDLRVLHISQKAAAIAVRLGNSSPTLLNVRNRAHAHISSAKRCGACRKKHNARVLDINIWLSTGISWHDNVLPSWPTRRVRQRPAGKKIEALSAELMH